MIVVVAGTGRKIGKTSVAAGLIAALRDLSWTGIKISGHSHEQGWGVTEDLHPAPTDTGRYLAAGAHRAFWIRAAETEMAAAAAAVERIAFGGVHTIVESNSVLRYLSPGLIILVMDCAAEPKQSALYAMRRSDAVIVPNAKPGFSIGHAAWFVVQPPLYVTPAIADFVRQKLMAESGSERSDREAG